MAPPSEVAVLVEDLCFAYPALEPGGDPVSVLEGIDMTIRRGDFLGLMGRTGAGKTTLCLALVGLVPGQTGGDFSGRVTVAGLDTSKHRTEEIGRQVGLVFQDAESQLFNMTVEDEVAFGLECLGVPVSEMRERITWALAAVGLEDLQRRSPFRLSGGQKKRLAIASVLVMEPEVLVLDEPLADLDPRGQAEVLSVLGDLKESTKMTVVLVENDAEPLGRWADRVMVLADGRIQVEGPPDEVFADPDLLYQLGVAPPQMSELADALNQEDRTYYRFTDEEGAYRALSASLQGRA